MPKQVEKEGNKIKKENAKLRNNAIFGTLIENALNIFDVKIVTNRKNYFKVTSFRTSIRRKKQFDNGLIVIEKDQCKIQLNKPTLIGARISELSKVLMHDFYYNHIKNKYGDKAKLLFGDTYNLIYEIKIENVYENFYKDKEFFDFSKYSKD